MAKRECVWLLLVSGEKRHGVSGENLFFSPSFHYGCGGARAERKCQALCLRQTPCGARGLTFSQCLKGNIVNERILVGGALPIFSVVNDNVRHLPSVVRFVNFKEVSNSLWVV